LSAFNVVQDTVTCSDETQAAADADGDGVCDPDDVCLDFDDRVDSDSDGLADGCDACPFDVAGDSDGDGVCDSDDRCPGAPDTDDQDGDGVPDGCDACPDDTLNDADGDGLCDDTDDPCPGDPDNNCGTAIQIDMQVDGFYTESHYVIAFDPDPLEATTDGEVNEAGDFSQANEQLTLNYTVESGWNGCVFLIDDYGDGGVEGQVADVTSGQTVLATWTKTDYNAQHMVCFVVP
jgi:hypothetical protein